MIVASFGGGVNSTAMLVGLWERGEKVDLILFADTGGEKPHTYAHVMEMSEWPIISLASFRPDTGYPFMQLTISPRPG